MESSESRSTQITVSDSISMSLLNTECENFDSCQTRKFKQVGALTGVTDSLKKSVISLVNDFANMQVMPLHEEKCCHVSNILDSKDEETSMSNQKDKSDKQRSNNSPKFSSSQKIFSPPIEEKVDTLSCTPETSFLNSTVHKDLHMYSKFEAIDSTETVTVSNACKESFVSSVSYEDVGICMEIFAHDDKGYPNDDGSISYVAVQTIDSSSIPNSVTEKTYKMGDINTPVHNDLVPTVSDYLDHSMIPRRITDNPHCGVFSDAQSEHSSDSGKGGSDVPTCPENPDCTPAEIHLALQLIRNRFLSNQFSSLTLAQVNIPLMYSIPVPHTLQLHLPEGVSCDVILSSMVSAGHFFLQQPTHPTYTSLSCLDQCMNACYAQTETPLLPLPLKPGVICAAPIMDGWFRVQVVYVYENMEECNVKFVDYGGYSTLPIASLRQIRSDFMTLPFQAAEFYLANVKPVDEELGWSVEACNTFEEIAQGQILKAIIVAYAEDEIPCVNLYRVQGVSVSYSAFLSCYSSLSMQSSNPFRMGMIV
ncbi:uncharacterized protein LOC111088239 [Limulus polyphemus]|uniref:Uncharacterized protein LOC111088239 n=1 Tax=Limulus polyphemus TaxID=6850 RepID=A0ABM1TC57_LIMPO|nr:uncharacterized protein LOC111088239 [Limulus polyphemus]